MSAIQAAVHWTVAKLLADATLTGQVSTRVYEGVAPANCAYPHVLVQVYGDARDTGFLGGRALTEVELSVRVVTQAPNPKSACYTAYNRVDALLDHAAVAVDTYGTISGCVRVAEQSMTEALDGTARHYVGGRYVVTVC